METNHQSPVPCNSNRERASNIQGASTSGEILSQESNGANNQHVISYHRRYPDGEYVPVMLSPGYPFSPEDDELIVDYLNKEINKEQAPYISIPKVNVYKHTPEELAETHQSMGKDEWYFFSPRDRKYLNGNRPNRAAGNGYWKATGADIKISRNGEFVGSKKCLVFYQGKPPKGNKTNWVMQEYVADQPPRQRLSNDLDDCVLCRIYKKSELSPKEEKDAAASESSETAKPAASKSSENKKQAAPCRHVKTEHEGTNQQHINLPVQQPNLSMLQQNQQAIHYSFPSWSYNLGGQLDFHPDERNPDQETHPDERNPDQETQPMMPQPNIFPQQQNQHAIIHYSPQPWSYNLGGQLDFQPESNSEEAQVPNMLQPNLPIQQQNPRATQYSFQAETHDLGGQLDFPFESIPEEANQFHFDNPGNSHETVGVPTYPTVFQNGFNDFYSLPSMDSFHPIPPSLDNNDHPQNGT